jgi:hypothetical protein
MLMRMKFTMDNYKILLKESYTDYPDRCNY